MPTADGVPWELLEERSATAFLVAGGLWAIDTGVNLLELFAGTSVPGAVFFVFILSSLLITVVGVLGFYRGLADRGSRLGLAGAVLLGVAGTTVVVVLAWGIAASLLGRPLPPGSLGAVIVLLLVLGLFLFGVASVRADTPSRIAGLLVLALVATWLIWLAGVAGFLGANPEWSSAAFGVVLSAVTLAIGYHLRTGGAPTGRAEPTSDSPTG